MATLAEREVAPRARFATPEATLRTFAAALGQARLGWAMECFAAQASFVTPDATGVSGRAGIGEVLAQLIDQRAGIEIDSAGALIAGDLAFVSQRWRLSLGSDPSSRQSQEVTPLLVLRQVAQEWKLAIIAPWGRP